MAGRIRAILQYQLCGARFLTPQATVTCGYVPTGRSYAPDKNVKRLMFQRELAGKVICPTCSVHSLCSACSRRLDSTWEPDYF